MRRDALSGTDDMGTMAALSIRDGHVWLGNTL
jgi:hypothetical protein